MSHLIHISIITFHPKLEWISSTELNSKTHLTNVIRVHPGYYFRIHTNQLAALRSKILKLFLQKFIPASENQPISIAIKKIPPDPEPRHVSRWSYLRGRARRWRDSRSAHYARGRSWGEPERRWTSTRREARRRAQVEPNSATYIHPPQWTLLPPSTDFSLISESVRGTCTKRKFSG